MKLNESGKQEHNYTGGIPSSRGRMQSYILIYSSLKERVFDSSGFSAERTLISAFAVPHSVEFQTNQTRYLNIHKVCSYTIRDQAIR